MIEVNHGYDGGGKDSNSRRIHGVDEPLRTLTKVNGMGLSTACASPDVPGGEDAADIDPARLALIDGQPYILDIRFRMLKNVELARAMGFEDAETTYEFQGNVGDVTRQIGNAVPVKVASALVRAILGSA